MKRPKSGGGWQALRYTLKKSREVGPVRLWKAMSAKNACKTCALGMGGQEGGMRNESGHFPEVCKKSLQAMAADMQGRIEPRFFETYSLDELRTFSPRELEHLGRLTEPVIARPGDTHYRAVSWEEAFSVIGESLLQSQPERTLFYASGRSSNEAGFLLNLFGRSLGTNHITNCSYYCHQASGVGLHDAIGTKTATIELEDLDKADLVFLIGGNPASNHPRLMTSLMKLRNRGGKVIVVNPLKETGLVNFKVPSSVRSMLLGTEIASQYLQPTIGGDIALLIGIAKCLRETPAIDLAYIKSYTEQYDLLSECIEGVTWEDIVRASGVPRKDIEEAASAYAESERTIFAWTMGITHHVHGVENVHWISNLALMRGMVGRPGSGLLPIRGHSNVQGMGTIGVTPAMSKAALGRLSELGIVAADFEGLDTVASIEAAHDGQFDFGLCLGGNLLGASPDATYSSEALDRVKTLVYLNTTMNTTHTQGRGQTTLILPVCARDEEDQSTTQESMFSFVRVSEGGPSRHQGPKTETAIFSELGRRVFPAKSPLDWEALSDHDEIRKLISKLVPELGEIESVGQTKKEFSIPGRVLHEPRFGTPTGKAVFQVSGLPKSESLAPNELRLMTIRSEGQFNTVVYEEYDIYRGQERRDVVLMNPADIERLGLKADQLVDIKSSVGRMEAIIVRPFEIAVGCAAMYYPEANVLVPRKADPRSKTPAFKSVVICLTPSKRSAPLALSSSAQYRASRGKMKSC